MPSTSRLSPIEQRVFRLTKAKFQLHMITTTQQVYDTITVGAAVLRQDLSNNAHPQILVLKRKESEDEVFSGVFELPWGNVEETDESIQGAVFRAVKQATGLKVREIIFQLSDMPFTAEREVVRQDGTTGLTVKNGVQVSCVVITEGSADGFQVNRNEHEEGTWVTKERLGSLPMTDEMQGLVLQALELCEAHV